MKYIDMNEVIKLFINNIYNFLISGEKISKVKISFAKEDYEYLKTIFDEKSMDKISKDIDAEYLISVTDAKKFFQKLTTLVNLHIETFVKYYPDFNIRAEIEGYLKYVWLRMTPYDFLDVQKFLDLQISYAMNEKYFDNLIYYNGAVISGFVVGDYEGYTVTASKDMNNYYYETDTAIRYELYDKESRASYYLPMIHYGIDTLNEKPVCHIYGLQQDVYGKQDKKIERSLYKLNKGISNPDNHPSFVLALNLFINMLKDNDIYDIEVPLLEVLNYGYHEKVSDESKKRFDARWEDETIDNEEYQEDKKALDAVADKQDFISKAKVENLSNLFLRYQSQFDDISISVEDYILKINIKNMKKMI